MAEEFRIVLSGKTLAGFDRAGVQRSLAALFRIDEERAGRLLSGNPVALKKRYAGEDAGRLCDRLESIGVACSARAVTVEGEPPVSVRQPPQGGEQELHLANAANFSGKPLPVKIAIVCTVLASFGYMWKLFLVDDPDFRVMLFVFTIYLLVAWALVRAYRIGWIVGIFMGAGWAAELGVMLAAPDPQLEYWRLPNIALSIVLLFTLLMPSSLRLLRVGFVSRMALKIPPPARVVLPLVVMLAVLPRFWSWQTVETDNHLARDIGLVLFAVKAQQATFTSETGHWNGHDYEDWPVGEQLKLENMQYGKGECEAARYVSRVTFLEGRTIEVKFIDSIFNGGSIMMHFNDMGILDKCHTDTIPGRFINPTCINCACGPSSSSIR